MFKNSAQPTLGNLRSRVAMVIEAANSGHVVGAKWKPRNKAKQREFVKAMKAAEQWAQHAKRILDQ